jgi:hypothetical protein
VIDTAKAEPSRVFQREGTTVTAQRIPHGNMPTLAYRVQTGNLSVVFSSDQNGTDPKFVEFAKGANVLIMHLAIAPGADVPLHATPLSSAALHRRRPSDSSSSVISACSTSMRPLPTCENSIAVHSSSAPTCNAPQRSEVHTLTSGTGTKRTSPPGLTLTLGRLARRTAFATQHSASSASATTIET